MDAILFGMKRAHQVLNYRFAVPMLDPHGLTPARFDALYVIRRCGGCALPQASMRRELGVTAPTVSRMLRKLDRLGFVERSTYRRGARRNVRLTPLGKAVIRRALKKTYRKRFVQHRVDRLLSFGKDRFLDRCGLDDYCRVIRDRLGDRSIVSYPWHPDD